MKHFCVMPWYSNEINLNEGITSVCCWMSSNVDLTNVEKIRQQFINNEKPKICNKCWAAEDAGIESRRQMENRFLDYALDRDLNLIEQDVINGKVDPMLYQINLGSVCNATCVTCGPMFSTAWQALLKTQISIKRENSNVDEHFDKFKNKINWANLKRLNLLGGEPLLIRKHIDILTSLLEHNNTDCLISFVTNGSIKLAPKHIKLFEKFSNISCCLSIDGIGSTYDYLRYPLQWTDLVENLKQYRSIFKEVTVSFTVSNLNVHKKNKIIEWFKQEDLKYIENHVNYPSYFNPKVRPGHALWGRFVEEIKKQDQLKGISIGDYMPELAELIKIDA